MSYNQTNVSVSLPNTGLQNFAGGTGKLAYLAIVPKDFEIATQALALTKDTWIDNINAAAGSRILILPLIFNATPTQGEPIYMESDYGHKEFVDNGKLDYLIEFFQMHQYNEREIFKLNNGSFNGYFITDANFIEGFTADGIKFKPFQFDYTRVLPKTANTAKTNGHVQFSLRFSDARQYNDYKVSLDCINDELLVSPIEPWYPAIELPASAIKDLKVTLNSLSATAFNFTLKGFDGVAYSGAVKEDIYLRKTTVDGTLIAITSITETAVKGVYTGVIGTQTSGTFYLSLLDQPTATTQGFETPVPSSLVVTIP